MGGYKSISLTQNGKRNSFKIHRLVAMAFIENPENKSFPWVQRFEEAFASKMNTKYAIAVNSGTSGLHAALFAAGIQEGDEVIQPALTVVMDGSHSFAPSV